MVGCDCFSVGGDRYDVDGVDGVACDQGGCLSVDDVGCDQGGCFCLDGDRYDVDVGYVVKSRLLETSQTA